MLLALLGEGREGHDLGHRYLVADPVNGASAFAAGCDHLLAGFVVADLGRACKQQ